MPWHWSITRGDPTNQTYHSKEPSISAQVLQSTSAAFLHRWQLASKIGCAVAGIHHSGWPKASINQNSHCRVAFASSKETGLRISLWSNIIVRFSNLGCYYNNGWSMMMMTTMVTVLALSSSVIARYFREKPIIIQADARCKNQQFWEETVAAVGRSCSNDGMSGPLDEWNT